MSYTSDISRRLAEAERRARLAVAKTTMDITAGAKARAPVDTGHLKNSIQGSVDGLEGEITVGAEYAAHQEYGTRHMSAQPYLVPAAEQARHGFEGAIRQAFDG